MGSTTNNLQLDNDVILGGGVPGLTLAHCLEQAGMSYIIWEAGSEIAPAIGASIGASIGILPYGIRILDQLAP